MVSLKKYVAYAQYNINYLQDKSSKVLIQLILEPKIHVLKLEKKKAFLPIVCSVPVVQTHNKKQFKHFFFLKRLSFLFTQNIIWVYFLDLKSIFNISYNFLLDQVVLKTKRYRPFLQVLQADLIGVTNMIQCFVNSEMYVMIMVWDCTFYFPTQ